MKAVILAAGMATRLKPLTDETPKTLLEINGKPILYYMLNNLKMNGIYDIVIVTGFMREKIEDYVKNNFNDLKFEFVYNKDYNSTNNAYSLLLTEDYVKEFILLDSDIVFHPEIIKKLLNFSKRPVLAIEKHECLDEEIKVLLDKQNRVLDISKTVDPKIAFGESIGIEVFDERAKSVLFDTLEKRIIKEGRVNEFYEASFKEMIDNGFNFYGIDTSEYPAIEIDFVEDLNEASKLIKEIYKN
ncbi:MAG TPA: phosphocholine cytidylyltransferase family protein [Spirochaetota bacterium]|nr:phosphocholine cytidylyltransferase family protein [Spirochaetota bacterium]HOM38506.1 phosphocholine cytidylyltransferase family protein [Spirochaetota bacterium]HPQ49046.1 phosphocholine cytidylyltransferase family protein [Spirochaetota bacterium]